MIMLMAFGMRGDYYWRKSIKEINVSSYKALSFSLAGVKVSSHPLSGFSRAKCRPVEVNAFLLFY